MLDKLQIFALLLTLLVLSSCDKNPWNNPYSGSDSKSNILYSSFSERPKHLDPALSYNANEWLFINQIYEPPLQYHYLLRPYQLMPLTATHMPTISYYDEHDQEIPKESPASKVAYTLYRIQIKPGIYYQKHPAFAINPETNQYYYHRLKPSEVRFKYTISDFKEVSTRELTSEDYVYQIKRLADPTLNSPILGLMETHIIGLKELSLTLAKHYKEMGATEHNIQFLNLQNIPFDGAKTIDKYTYEIKISGKYPQFIYWLAMPFFSPMPWEAVAFYSQNVLRAKNISLDWYPIGTGPFLLEKNNPNLEMILKRNSEFHGEFYPSGGEAQDEAQGLLAHAGKPLPFLDKVIFILEKEDIPYWSKFLQGYYDQSGVGTNNFDQAIKISGTGNLELTEELKNKGIQLNSSVQPSDFYWGFNMLDETVGGYTENKRKLRQAISIAVDVEEYINIFLNGNAIPAQNIIPPTIFGFKEGREGMNPMIYKMNHQGSIERKDLNEAKKLLHEAGYPEGIDPKTKLPLVLYFDAIITGGTESAAQFAWLRKQFKKLGIELIIRATQYNRFQDKIRNGDVQIYWWGWNADYPDPENFLFLLYGPNGKVKFDGENASNYFNAKFDKLFDQIKTMENMPEREIIISQMLKIIQEDAPWIWGFHPTIYTLRQAWVSPFKPNAMSRNTIKYISIDPVMREKYRLNWNEPFFYPLGILLLVLILFCVPAFLGYWKRMHLPLKLEKRIP